MMATSKLLRRYIGILEAAKVSSASFASSSSGNGKGLMRLQPVSPQLGKFLGSSEASRADATKKIWEYIKLHNLQNPANKKEIICDEKLKTIFDGKDRVGMLEVAKYLSPHFVKSK
ncbi:ABC transporter G family member 14-like isoform X1 [Hibiscus syriacus]|uniref:ABC transporter G family member 14-like isoform X1 n=1 Tax=Hibiscus syriacus TaxID=106335 RepID=A0A6A2YJI7_HIBSY|nr:upstream activation factor subunit spp27-like [Hibiscus syriacus]KAE8677517.1 ABC transporter G family member 14-like isoform X1 [Hibiscus syriacus]